MNRGSSTCAGSKPCCLSSILRNLKVAVVSCALRRRTNSGRTEEHTSELQALMRISYAVFCLTKKTIITRQTKTQYINIYKHSRTSPHSKIHTDRYNNT